MRTWADRGGTFTDLLTEDDHGTLHLRKVPSDVAILGELARGPLVFGTTAVTNALLEGRFARVHLIVTAGFEDILALGDGTRPDLFRPERAPTLPPIAGVTGVPGRTDPGGRRVEALDLAPLDALNWSEIDAVAVALLHGAAEDERAVRDAIAGRCPTFLSCELVADVGYVARVGTTVAEAGLAPILADIRARDAWPADALAMRSDGSLVAARDLRAVDALLSGPAGGALAVAHLAEALGERVLVGLDMGGTSTDVCVAVHGHVPLAAKPMTLMGLKIARPHLDISTVAAGGGSLISIEGGLLRVGPRSAGANPGPMARGLGTVPTLTDATLLQGLVRPDAYDPPLDPARVHLPVPAAEVLSVAREVMAAQVSLALADRGQHAGDAALLAFGGAAGQHAADVAERAGLRRVWIHPLASALSAWGLTRAVETATAMAPLWVPADASGWNRLHAAWIALDADLPRSPNRVRNVRMRVTGTDATLDLAEADSLTAQIAAFHVAHRDRWGFDRPAAVEFVAAMVTRMSAPPPPAAPPSGSWEGPLGEGPTIFDGPGTRVVVPKGWTATRVGDLVRLDGPPPTAAAIRGDGPAAIAQMAARLGSVAERAGAVLRQLAQSVNIRERQDFSCAVFDRDGQLVVHAPHVPVHLGAMGACVRDVIAHVANLADGQMWLTNDPRHGGSHLPDLTLVTPVEGGRWFVASRGHHADVGGLTPGSMPPTASHIEEEGRVWRIAPVHRWWTDGVGDALDGCRFPQLVLADLAAQAAANHAMAQGLRAWDPEALDAAMARVQDAAEASVARWLAGRGPFHAEAEDDIDGLRLHVALTSDGQHLTVDFSATDGPHPGNLNAPNAVVQAAVLWALRVEVAEEVPLNEGVMRRVEVVTRPGSMLDPPETAAVAGGNVETSQRIADLVFRALDARAAGQGTMNNFTLGGPTWAFYETIGGGGGASPRAPGLSGRQVGMTNTHGTDPEVLERRLPLRLRRWQLRTDSGGSGTQRGGDGVIREIEVLAPATACLIARRRDVGPSGLDGGADGLPGEDHIVRAHGSPLPWDGNAIELLPGDRIVIRTPGGGGWGRGRP